MKNQYNIKPGDYLICIKSYVETEFRHRFTNDNKQIHLFKGSRYKVENIAYKRIESSNFTIDYPEIEEVQVINEFGLLHWYSIDRFMNLKQWRKTKLKRLNKISN